MKRWEYCIKYITDVLRADDRYAPNDAEFLSFLQSMGAGGWELVTMTEDFQHSNAQFYFKREKT